MDKGIYSWRGSSRPENWQDLDFPSHRPFFQQIIADNESRIYVVRFRSILESSSTWELDVFGKDGSYLYRIKIPFRPNIIRGGFLYEFTTDEKLSDNKIIRYKIRNWNSMKIEI